MPTMAAGHFTEELVAADNSTVLNNIATVLLPEFAGLSLKSLTWLDDLVREQVGYTTPWSAMTQAERRAFQHSYSRHASELGLPNWAQSRVEELQNLFNNAVKRIRDAGINGFFESQELVNGVKTTVKRTEPVINGQKFYYYETLTGKFISAGKM